MDKKSYIKNRMDKINSETKFIVKAPFPKTIMIEPTTACNLQCSFCNNKKSKREKSFIPFGLVKKILSDAYQNGTRSFGIYLYGEPLLHRNIEQFTSYASELGYEYIYITSNGLLANQLKIKKLRDCGLSSLKFSINAGNREEYACIHGVDAYKIVIKNLEDAIGIKKNDTNFKVLVSSVNIGTNSESIFKLRDKYKNSVDDFVIVDDKRNSAFLN